MKSNRKVIFSNYKWFQGYSILRVLLIVFTLVVYIVPQFFDMEKIMLMVWFEIIAIALVVAILIFDFFQKPSFIELIKEEVGFTLRQFRPDARFLFFYDEGKVHTTYIADHESLACQITKGVLPLFDQIEFFVEKDNAVVSKSNRINVAWMSTSQYNQLNECIEVH